METRLAHDAGGDNVVQAGVGAKHSNLQNRCSPEDRCLHTLHVSDADGNTMA